ncbi:MAG: metal-dependent transcriptional regulator [Clostridia bacterium]|nr:metal-dependent transcriptional regulator [Clostridia bacterium]
MLLKESGEMYLESIYVLCKEKSRVRSIDVAEHMSYSKPSVSRGVGILKQQNYIVVDKDGYITLTEEGKAAAEKIFERHTILTRLLVSIGVDEETAADDACRIEHVISDKTFHALKDVVKKL